VSDYVRHDETAEVVSGLQIELSEYKGKYYDALRLRQEDQARIAQLEAENAKEYCRGRDDEIKSQASHQWPDTKARIADLTRALRWLYEGVGNIDMRDDEWNRRVENARLTLETSSKPAEPKECVCYNVANWGHDEECPEKTGAKHE
jgi:hypothetical protein